ncbi:hypothetical protein ANN_16288 [Periplaneta americana]|uniref:Uncharacterized protein n=1 Tax=Periplaneta americana TaxID=6978 RepID=A0ABQ8SJC3_PERAM|nr:hypothetical protein ANN_16288 [Periplaneta americana]
MNAPFIMDDDENWAPIHEELAEVNIENFVSVDNGLVTSEIRGDDDAATTTQGEDSDEEIESAEKIVSTPNKPSEQ